MATRPTPTTWRIGRPRKKPPRGPRDTIDAQALAEAEAAMNEANAALDAARERLEAARVALRDCQGSVGVLNTLCEVSER